MKNRISKLALFSAFASCSNAPVHGQAPLLDSLSHVISTAALDTVAARAASEVAQLYMGSGEQDSAFTYIRKAEKVIAGRGPNDPAGRRLQLRLAKLRGILHTNASQYDSALIAFQLMQKLAESLGRTNEASAALTYQGYQLREMGDLANALTVTREAVDALTSAPEGPDMANACNGMGLIHTELGNTDSAVHWLSRAAALYGAQGNQHHWFNAQSNIAECLNTAGRWEESDSVVMLQAPIAASMEDPVAYLHFAGGNARALLRRNKVQQAIHVLDSAVALATVVEQKNAEHYLLLLRSLARANQSAWNPAMKDMMASLDAHTADMDYDKIRSTEAIRQSAEREKETAIAQAQLGKERVRKWAAVIIGTLALILALVWFRSWRAQQRAAAILARKNEEILLAQAQLVESQKKREAELVRTRIARDIHDEIGASITKIALLSSVAATKSGVQEETRKTLSRIGEHTTHISRSLSDIVWAVDPQRDSHQGMLDHVRDLAQRLLGDNGIRFDLDLHAEHPTAEMPPALKRDLHLVLNECFNNILKYAHAHSVIVKLHLVTGSFLLRVDDDGVGFDPGTVPDRGNGLKNMPARMKAHGGALSITSAPGRGTVLIAHGPIP